MALQKWAAPAGSPLLATRTVTGPNGTSPLDLSVAFGAQGDIAVGAVLRLTAHGLITTTGTPTITFTPSLFNVATATFVAPLDASADLTAQVWHLDMAGTYDGTNIRYTGTLKGITDADVVFSEVVGPVDVDTYGAFWNLAIDWDTGDSGDVLIVHGAFAEWIG